MKKLMLSLAVCAALVCGLAASPSGDNWGRKITGLGEAQDEVALVFTNTAEEMSRTIPDSATSLSAAVDDKGVMTITEEGVYDAGGETIDGYTGHTTTSELDVNASATLANGTYKFGGLELIGDDDSAGEERVRD